MTMSKKVKAALAGTVAAGLLAAGVGIAYAYWTTTGSGTGSASTTTDVTADKISLAQIGTVTGFYPGGPAQNVVVRATNPALYSQVVGNVTVVVQDAGLCLASNWAVVDSTDSFGNLAAGASSAPAGQTVATIQLKDLATNQDDCKSKNPVLTFSSAPGA
jgi:hypothetical protein